MITLGCERVPASTLKIRFHIKGTYFRQMGKIKIINMFKKKISM